MNLWFMDLTCESNESHNYLEIQLLVEKPSVSSLFGWIVCMTYFIPIKMIPGTHCSWVTEMTRVIRSVAPVIILVHIQECTDIGGVDTQDPFLTIRKNGNHKGGESLSVLAKLQQRHPALVAFVLFSATVDIISVLAMIINYSQCLALMYMPQVHSVLWHIPHFRAHNTTSVALPLCSVASESGLSLVRFYFHILLYTVVYQKAC